MPFLNVCPSANGGGCYEIMGEKKQFTLKYYASGELAQIIIDFGTYSQTLFQKIDRILGSKYRVTFRHTQEQRKLYNDRKITALYNVYRKGSVVLKRTNRMYLIYNDASQSRVMLKTLQKTKLKSSDF